MKLGIIQGRLSAPVNNHIQEFPYEKWREEFNLLNKLNLNHVEWIITKDSYNTNPLFNSDLKNFKISSICCDHIIDDKIEIFSYLYDNLLNVCKFATKNNINYISIPLLEQSNMESDTRRNEFIKSILKIKELTGDTKFIFETELTPEKSLEIVSSHKDFYITYDTGNVNSYLKEHEKYIKILQHKIINVHLKDRTFDAKTVIPFTGDTNFDQIFKFLKEINYNSMYTLQIARGITGQEEAHIIYYKNKFKELHDKYFI
jgi:hypothetical protein